MCRLNKIFPCCYTVNEDQVLRNKAYMEQQIELRIIERQRKLESAIQKLTKENNEFKRQINRQAQEREEFDKKIEKYLDLNNKNKELIEEKNIALEKIEELNRLNVNLQDEIDRLKTEKSQLEIKNKSLKESEKKTNPCIESVIKANLNMKQEFQDLNDENEKLDEKVKNLEKDINDLSQTNQKLREEFESLKCEKDQIEKINDKMDGLNTKIAGLNDQLIENKGEDQSELNKALQEQKKLAANLISFQEKRYEKIVKNLKNKLEREKTDRSKLEKDNFRLFSTSRTDMKNQEKKDKSIDELEKKLKETQLKLNKISAERDGHKKHVSILQRKNSNLELNEKLSLTSFIECERELTQIKSDIENKEKIELANQLKEFEENAELLKKNYSDELEQKELQIKTLNEKIGQLSLAGTHKDPTIVNTLNQNKKEIEELKRKLESKDKIATERLQECQRKEENIKELQKLVKH